MGALAYKTGQVVGIPVRLVRACLGASSWQRGGELRTALKAAIGPLVPDMMLLEAPDTLFHSRFWQGDVLGKRLPPVPAWNVPSLPPCSAVNPGSPCSSEPALFDSSEALVLAAAFVLAFYFTLRFVGRGSFLLGVRRHVTAFALFACFFGAVWFAAAACNPSSPERGSNLAIAAALAVGLHWAYHQWGMIRDL